MALILLAKGKSLLTLLKFGKFGGALVSMAASIGAYALIYPWGFAIGLVLLLFIHEVGHVLAAKRKGMPVSAPLFIPFMGALINMKRHPADAQTEAYIAFGGPLLGTVGALAVYGAAYYTGSPLLYSLAYVGFFLNLINLLPIHPLDGGRISTAVTRWLWLVGVVGGLAVIIYLKSVLFFIIWAMFAYDLYKKFVRRAKPGEQVRTSISSFLLPVEVLSQQPGFLLPAPDHRRELSFQTFSTLDRVQHVELRWDSLEFRGELELPEQGLIQRTRVAGLQHLHEEDGLHLKLYCEVDYIPFENNLYYEVPQAVRWRYGVGYFLLAAFLVVCMYSVHQVDGFLALADHRR
ncbi:site-2 protease family protein [Paenibacillus sp. JX-17]|uniref:Site-2 protease family protein n=1 Tax=Paenibacillus lacisoli TaxID=3064525 RepID=A0ABT9CDQ6_9BACL|nr:site-2 protease family protein [Paenibacillus sp. JX-17]MDO7906774.1 site-2 protease family protein [Paenibacillus sp. JX-17]